MLSFQFHVNRCDSKSTRKLSSPWHCVSLKSQSYLAVVRQSDFYVLTTWACQIFFTLGTRSERGEIKKKLSIYVSSLELFLFLPSSFGVVAPIFRYIFMVVWKVYFSSFFFPFSSSNNKSHTKNHCDKTMEERRSFWYVRSRLLYCHDIFHIT